jgi:hypothetical protein
MSSANYKALCFPIDSKTSCSAHAVRYSDQQPVEKKKKIGIKTEDPDTVMKDTNKETEVQQ